MDFTSGTYKKLLKTLRNQGFCFMTFSDYLSEPSKKAFVLRHDVDKLPMNSLEFARIQTEADIRGTFYFRVVPESWDEAIIREIAGMGHEVGYHYEDLGSTAQRHKGVTAEDELVKIAINSFAKNLETLRKIVPVKTVCMHGSPMSRWDSRLLWKYFDYRDFGIIGEPYFDVNFDEVMYLTDTGRRWDGDSVNIRDKAEGGRLKAEGKAEGVSIFAKASVDEGRKTEGKTEGLFTFAKASVDEGQKAEGEEKKRRLDYSDYIKYGALQPSALSPQPPALFPRFHSTFDIIKASEAGQLPDKIMMTFHPQRWSDKPVPWVKELIWQNVKNVGKYFLVKIR